MARQRKPTLPFATVSNRASLPPDAINWEQIEVSYGEGLSSELRNEILKLTASFVDFAPFELTAEPLAHAHLRIAKLKDAALGFEQMIDWHDTSDARIYADQQIHRRLDTKLTKDRHLFGELRATLLDFVTACNLALEETRDSSVASLRQGECWDKWVCGLTETLKRAALPTGVSNDSHSRCSPFTLLVCGLQSCVPKDLRQYTFSKEALAQAIIRARRDMKRQRKSR